MLSRAQVARRIGKSIATVRRLEGVELHPRKDRSGVHRFDPNEVERLESAIRQGHRLPSGLPSSGGDELSDLRRRVAELERVVEEILGAFE